MTKEEKKAQKKGMFARIAIRVIDNLEIDIKDIHIRFEDSFCFTNKPYAFGITIKSISMITIDDNDVKAFIDRTNSKHKEDPLYKKLIMNKLSIYWSDNPKSLLSAIDNQEALEKSLDNMDKLIEDNDFILRPCILFNSNNLRPFKVRPVS